MLMTVFHSLTIKWKIFTFATIWTLTSACLSLTSVNRILIRWTKKPIWRKRNAVSCRHKVFQGSKPGLLGAADYLWLLTKYFLCRFVFRLQEETLWLKEFCLPTSLSICWVLMRIQKLWIWINQSKLMSVIHSMPSLKKVLHLGNLSCFGFVVLCHRKPLSNSKKVIYLFILFFY